MESILLAIMFDLPGLEDVKELVISRQVVEGTTPPLYIYTDRPDRTGDAGASASRRQRTGVRLGVQARTRRGWEIRHQAQRVSLA
jgi:hypothetical protein